MRLAIKVISGPDQGAQINLIEGQTMIGRNADSAIPLRDQQAGWDHLLIRVADQKAEAENLSSTGTWLNDEKIVGKTRLRAGDRLRLSPLTEVELIEQQQSGSNWMIWTIVGSLFLTLIVAIFAGGEKKTAPTGNYRYAYASLDAWLGRAAAQNKAPPELSILLRDAWRLDRANSYAPAATAWSQLLSAASPQTYQTETEGGKVLWSQVSQKQPDALDSLLQASRSDVSDQTAIAALLQLARVAADYNLEKSREGE